METRKSVFELKGHTERLTSVAVSGDGRRIVTGSSDKTARVWDTATGELLHELKGHTNHVLKVGISPDGRRVVTGCQDSTAGVWDAITGQRLHELKGFSKEITGVGFSPDGRRVITELRDPTTPMRIWDTDTGKYLPQEQPPAPIRTPNLLPDGRFVVPSWDRVTIVDPEIDQSELDRRRRMARPDPMWHANLAKQYQADPFAAAAQQSLKQQARGKLAVEAGDFRQAFGHFLAAEILRPHPVIPDPSKK